MVQKTQSEKAEYGRAVDALRAEIAATQRSSAEAADLQDKLRRDLHRLTDQLDEKDRQISVVRYTTLSYHFLSVI